MGCGGYIATVCRIKDCLWVQQCIVSYTEEEIAGTNRCICVLHSDWLPPHRKQACLHKRKQFPPEHSYQCRAGYSHTEYPRLEVELFCCRDADFCNFQLPTPPPGWPSPPPLRSGTSHWGGSGPSGGEGKVNASPVSPSYHQAGIPQPPPRLQLP